MQDAITKPMKQISNCNCIVAISDKLYKKLLKEMLYKINIKRIDESQDGAHAIFLLQENRDIDLIIVQEDLPVASGLDVIRFIRTDSKSHHPDMPILSVGWRWTRDKITAYRDAGINDVIVFPTSQYTMQSRILSALYSERSFIRTETYHGPDRRRRNIPGYQGPFRRSDDKPEPMAIAEKGEHDPIMAEDEPASPSIGAMSQSDLRNALAKKQKDKEQS